MSDILTYDIETRSQIDLTDVGAYVYAADKSTEPMCLAWALDDDPIRIWKPGMPVPKEATKHIQKGGLCVGFNVGFERQIHTQILGPRFGWPVPKLEQFRDLKAMGDALALPGSLENLAIALGGEVAKDKLGKRIMLQMTKPRKARKDEDENQVHWHDDDIKHGLLETYCINDVHITRWCYDRLWPLSDEEHQVWLMDQRINDRGFYVDKKLLLAMRQIIADADKDVTKEIIRLTGGTVQTVNQVEKIRTWLWEKHRIETENLSKPTVEELIKKTDTPKEAKEVLELRLAGAQAAVKKVEAFLNRRSKDGRVRGAFVYHAAGTGRWSSRGAQVHNLKRLITEEQEEIALAVDDLLTGDYKKLKVKYGRPLKVVGDNIRTCICAAPGNVLIGADFSGIEARITAWIAGEVRKLQVFRDYDAGEGPDPYVAAAADIFGLSLEEMTALKVSDPAEYKIKRQGGKGAELAFGFGGAENAYKRFMPEAMLANPGTFMPKADKTFQRRHGQIEFNPLDRTHDYATTTMVGKFTDEQITDIKVKWRKAHPNIVDLWFALGNATKQIAIKAQRIANGQTDIEIDPIQIKSLWIEYNEGYMFIVLPSGRRISYPGIGRAQSYRERFNIGKPENAPPDMRLDSFFMDNSSGRWHRLFFWHGVIIENIVQGIARDLLAYAMQLVEAAGLPLVAHVHDECVIEVLKKDAKRAKALFEKLMVQLPVWGQADDETNTPELPLVAKAWIAERYVK